MFLDIPEQTPVEEVLVNANLINLINLSLPEAYLLEMKISPSPLTFVEKFLLAISIPAVTCKAYIDIVYTNINTLLTTAQYAELTGYEKIKVDAIHNYFHVVKQHWDSVEQFDLGRYKQVVPIFAAAAIGIHVEALNVGMETDDIRKIKNATFAGQEEFSQILEQPIFSQFHHIHADLLDQLQTVYSAHLAEVKAPSAQVLPFNRNVH